MKIFKSENFNDEFNKFWDEFRQSENSMSMLKIKWSIYVALLSIILSFLLIFIYGIIIIKSILSISKNKTVLNIETIEYASVYYLTYLWVIFLGFAFLLLLSFKVNNESEYAVVNIGLIALFVAFVVQIIITYFASDFINKVKLQAEVLNTYIRTYIYKKSEIAEKLKQPNTDMNRKYTTILECIKILKNEQNQTELAKGFYTLTLYNYYSDLLVQNTTILQGAYKIFDFNTLLTEKNKVTPAAYMPRYGTFIEDIGEKYIRPHMSSSTLVNEAMYECDKMVAKTNELANTFYPDQAYNAFILMLIGTVLINVLLVGSVFYYGIKKPAVSSTDTVTQLQRYRGV